MQPVILSLSEIKRGSFDMSVKRISITGAAGQIAYSFLFRLAAGDLLGPNQPIALSLIELTPGLSILEGVKMELEDGAFPLLEDIQITDDPHKGFQDADLLFLIGSKPRGPGMERKDLLRENGKIFVEQGKAINRVAKPDSLIIVVGNPCNTNCLIAMSHAPRLSRKNFFAMTRLDENRARFFVSQKARVPVKEVSHLTIWGNHSSSMVPDFLHARIKGIPLLEVIQDRGWLENMFIPLVQKRGAAIIQARGKSSAASAASALIDTTRDLLGLSSRYGASELKGEEHWFSVGVCSDENPYQVLSDLIFSFPCRLHAGAREIISGLSLDEFFTSRIVATQQELVEEREIVKDFIG